MRKEKNCLRNTLKKILFKKVYVNKKLQTICIHDTQIFLYILYKKNFNRTVSQFDLFFTKY